MPEWQKARIENAFILPPANLSTPKVSGVPVAGAGSHLTLSFRPFPGSPFRVQWEAEIDEFSWNKHFCDRQVRGPFAYWRHCHYVRPANLHGIDATVITDDLEYELPLGLMGQLAHTLFMRRQIERTFAYRQRQLARMTL
jgi:ligand-binding SRPBCC domain-containing protein